MRHSPGGIPPADPIEPILPSEHPYIRHGRWQGRREGEGEGGRPEGGWGNNEFVQSSAKNVTPLYPLYPLYELSESFLYYRSIMRGFNVSITGRAGEDTIIKKKDYVF